MRMIFKGIGLIVSVLVAIIFLFIIFSYINHKIHLSKEDTLFIPNGTMVEVNGHKIHVYTEGEGDIPLVFMSGGGTSSPVLDFKSLYSLLSDKYKIVVIEKAGYGFSDIVNVDRDIDTILAETREALRKAEINGPFILLPHSMSGIEALYWTQKYPEEVKAIVGLDMALPEAYGEYNINMPIIKLGAFASNFGITRLIPSLAESDAIKYGTLTEEKKELYKVIFYRRTATRTMINEVKSIKANALKVAENKLPNIPILMFSSNGKGTGWSEYEWISFQENPMKNIENGEIIYLDCFHYIHDIEYERISEECERLIEV
ncbi:alpha/beta hydrolase [Clostridium sp. MSJ-4]|uniref:Alpha/beta hydrolase n=1 Tax=Clostridium simiarum TaxID=2841506 RepID=A0ABS6F1V8_9CLOT|nr:alpha/beta hydrolase [Clostridium simiarum]MBU5592491.1 alpha/beta hydrolase [Clostridium simiarum]